MLAYEKIISQTSSTTCLQGKFSLMMSFMPRGISGVAVRNAKTCLWQSGNVFEFFFIQGISRRLLGQGRSAHGGVNEALWLAPTTPCLSLAAFLRGKVGLGHCRDGLSKGNILFTS
jgi:hypothetical protein